MDNILTRIDALYAIAGPSSDNLLSAVRQLALKRLRGDEDAVQECIIAIWTRLDSYRPRSKIPFHHWVARIIEIHRIHLIRDGYNSAQFEPYQDDLSYYEDEHDPYVDFSSIKDGTIRNIAELISQGHTIKQCSEIMNTTEAAIKMRLKRYRDNLT